MDFEKTKQWINQYRSYIIALVTFLMVYISKDTLVFGTNQSGFATAILYCFMPLVLVCLVLVFISAGEKLSRSSIVMIGIYVASVLISALINLDFSFKYGWTILLILIAALYANLVNFPTFATLFTKIMCVLSAFSLLGAALYFVAYPLVELFPKIININGNEFFNLLLTTVPKKAEYVFFRNFGIFREPGVYIVFLNIALLFELNRKRKTSFWRFLLLVAGSLSTLSTAGYIVTFLIVCVGSFGCGLYTDKKKRMLMIGLGIAVGIVAILNFSRIFNLVFKKLFTNNESSSARFGSIWVNFLLLAEKPVSFLFGRGFAATENGFLVLAGEKGIAAHNTSSIFKTMALFGLPHLVLLLRNWYIFCTKAFRAKHLMYAAMAALVLLFNNEDMTVNILVYLLSFYACSNRAFRVRRKTE